MTTALTLPPSAVEQALKRDPKIKSEHSRRQYASNLRRFEEWREARPLTKTLVEAYAAHLQDMGRAPRTINQKLASIRWAARKIIDQAFESMTRGDLERAQLEKIKEQAAQVIAVEDVKGSRPLRGRIIKGSEFVKLIRACMSDPSPAGIRDAALFATAWMTGLRRFEYTRLHTDKLTQREETREDGSIEYYWEFPLIGKGDKHRPVYIIDGAYTAVKKWLEVRGSEPGYVFCPVRKGGVVAPTYDMSGAALRKILEKRQKEGGVREHITWHDFRYTLGGMLFEKGEDVATVQAIFGHSSATTTTMYDRRPESRRRKALHKLVLPKV